MVLYFYTGGSPAGETATLLLSALGTTITNKKNNGVWLKIQEQVMALEIFSRTVAELKDWWQKLKSDTLKRRNRDRTASGGPPDKSSPYDEFVLDILRDDTLLVSGIGRTY